MLTQARVCPSFAPQTDATSGSPALEASGRFLLMTQLPSSRSGFTMAAFNRPTEATYITHEEVTVDTEGVFV